MSQPADKKKKQGGMFRAILWLVALGVLGVVIGYVAGATISAVLSSTSANTFVSSQLMQSFGYSNASKVFGGAALQMFTTAQVFSYLFPVGGFAIGAVSGYFKGRREDKEEEE